MQSLLEFCSLLSAFGDCCGLLLRVIELPTFSYHGDGREHMAGKTDRPMGDAGRARKADACQNQRSTPATGIQHITQQPLPQISQISQISQIPRFLRFLYLARVTSHIQIMSLLLFVLLYSHTVNILKYTTIPDNCEYDVPLYH